MNIITATTEDAEELANVEIESKVESIPGIIGPVDIDYPTRFFRWQTYFAGKSPVSARPERIILKAVINEKTIGYLAGHLTNRYNKDAEIQSLYILKAFQRKGIGKALLEAFGKWLKIQGATSVCVGISPDNPYQAFYLKNGAEPLNLHWLYWDDFPSSLNAGG